MVPSNPRSSKLYRARLESPSAAVVRGSHRLGSISILLARSSILLSHPPLVAHHCFVPCPPPADMTEYATDPEVIQEFLHARDRTTNWVNIHSRGLSFASPSSPPSMLSDEDAPSYGPSESDASSSHSIPPRMLLHYEDGRPDVPISHEHSSTRSRSGHQSSRQSRSRSGSLSPTDPRRAPHPAPSLSYASGSRYATAAANLNPMPENIRVLPSRQPEDSQRPRASSTPHHPPAQAIFPPHQPPKHDRVPPLADPFHPSNRGPPPHPPGHSRSAAHHPIPAPASSSTASPNSQSHPHNGGSRFYERPGMAASQSGLPYAYSPPAIVYAPSGRHHRSNYQPPQIVYSPSSHGHRRAPGMAFSRSDPTPHPNQYSPEMSAGHTPFPSAQGSASHQRTRHQSMGAAERDPSRGRSYTVPSSSRNRTRTRSPTPALSDDDTASDSSGSTYYVLPSPGQKVQIIVSTLSISHISYLLHSITQARSDAVQPCCDYIRSLKRHPRSIAPPRGFHSVISTTEIMVRDASCAQCYLPSPFLVYRNVSNSTPDRYSGA